MHVAGADTIDEADNASALRAKAWESEIAKRRYAVIVDEAHSSQSGETARELKAILGASALSETDEEEPDWEDRLNQVMASRARQPNLSFFAYTATPKGKTLELFGRLGSSGKPEPFHLYSMRQAIEEKFILDVLHNYTTYDTYFKLIKKVQDDPNVLKKKASTALTKFLVLHPTNIEQKTEVIIEHFRLHIRHHLNGNAKAMVVTGSRLHAVRYMQAFLRYISEKGYADIMPLVAFSGTVRDPKTGSEYTEPGMNKDVVNGRFLIPHLPLEQDPESFKLSDEVGLQYYRLQRVFSGAIVLRDDAGDYGVKSPTDVGSGKAKDEKAPLSEIIEILNERFGTNFTEEDRLFFEQIREKATNTPAVIKLRQANPFDKFKLGLRKMIEDLMFQRMGENDKIVTRYMDDKAFENEAFAVLSKVIYETIPNLERSEG